ncbi:MAG TPA: transmembrane repetitive protein, partial [Pseudoxanthomonas sp.]|nr:transmembrane repetitive protein [Pseudoxanthomonas sp.]
GQARSGEPAPGGAPGLFDGQGRVRLPGDGNGPGAGPGAGPGQGTADRGPPGSGDDAWTRERIEQAGTWLKRPPYDYEPTSFDRYWVPHESLLAEWVRKGIKSVAIPIPGTNGKTLNCVVSLLQLGGGCGIADPNLNEQPAIARPPPDVPFKPELQEDNGSVRPAG